jgi:hypothetical protein
MPPELPLDDELLGCAAKYRSSASVKVALEDLGAG